MSVGMGDFVTTLCSLFVIPNVMRNLHAELDNTDVGVSGMWCEMSASKEL